MKRFPVRVPREGYRGRDPRKQAKVAEYNRVAAAVEDYLNEELAKRPEHSVTVFYSYEVAAAVRADDKLVHDVIFATDCGSNGITCWKGDYDRALQARE